MPAGREGLASMSKSPSTIAIERDRPLLTDLEPLQDSVSILLGMLGHGISIILLPSAEDTAVYFGS